MAKKADKHECYQAAVQDVRKEARNLMSIFSELSGENHGAEGVVPTHLQEDFCGTALLCREWVSKNPTRHAVGIDLDHDVLDYAQKKINDSNLCDVVHLFNGDVLSFEATELPAPHLVVALNYGICYFHRFSTLVKYFQRCRKILARGGIFICDLFNGLFPGNEPVSFWKTCNSFEYLFEQTKVDPLSNTCHGRINFKFSDGSWMRRAFSYHFRMWSLAEVKDAMLEAGFEHVDFYISLDDKDCAVSNRVYTRILDKVQDLHSPWNAYIAAR